MRAFRLETDAATPFNVRRARVRAEINALFAIELEVTCDDASLDLGAFVGTPMRLSLLLTTDRAASWQGICREINQLASENRQRPVYQLSIVPRLWLLSHRTNCRVFQGLSDLAVVEHLLTEWDIDYRTEVDPGAYRRRDLCVQYQESDYQLISRLLEGCGISFWFDEGGQLVLSDAPHEREAEHALSWMDSNLRAPRAYMSSLRVSRELRAGAMVMGDYDPRKAAVRQGEERVDDAVAERLECYCYAPGHGVYEATPDGSTPLADRRLAVRFDELQSNLRARRRLEAEQAAGRRYTFRSNRPLKPGDVVTMTGVPNNALDGQQVLITAVTVSARDTEHVEFSCQAMSAALPFRPCVTTPRPRIFGVQSATVVGPPGEEIHTDEFGRVRLHFHWDREHGFDVSSSCWIRVSQAWSGATYGMMQVPRVGQEVVVSFLDGDPDQPIVVGRLGNGLQPTNFKLPKHKTRTGWRSQSTPNGDGFNELSFEDMKGQELFYLRAERDMEQLVQNDQRVYVQNDRSLAVTHNSAVHIGGHHRVEIEQDAFVRARHATVRHTSTSERSETTHRIDVGQRLELICGNARLVMESSGKITLEGTDVHIGATGPTTIVGKTIDLN